MGGRLVREGNTTMDEDGRGSIGLVVGPGRRKDKHNYLGPQVEAEYNVGHGAC